jgi:hypothetical protein
MLLPHNKTQASKASDLILLSPLGFGRFDSVDLRANLNQARTFTPYHSNIVAHPTT